MRARPGAASVLGDVDGTEMRFNALEDIHGGRLQLDFLDEQARIHPTAHSAFGLAADGVAIEWTAPSLDEEQESGRAFRR